MATVEIFDVAHGSCALFTADTGRTILIDCGTNSDTGWTPARELVDRGQNHLDMLAITNCDEDHASGLPELRETLSIQTLWRAKNVSLDKIAELKSEHGMGKGIRSLVEMARGYTSPYVPVDYGNVQREMFYNPEGSFDDENNLSAVIVLTVHGIKFIFPGDIERPGLDQLMARKDFVDAIQGCDVLLAPHHGRESSVHKGFLGSVSPYWTVISDGPHQYKSQQTHADYFEISSGANFRGENRSVLSTRRDGHISFNVSNAGWSAE